MLQSITYRFSVPFILALSFFILISPKPAHAVSCYGDYCSGKDPVSSGCNADGQTLAWVDVDGARLDLRWSTVCKTEWARWQQYPMGLISTVPYKLSAVQDTGYSQSRSYDINGPGSNTTTWTPMIYSPIHRVQAVANVWCGDMTILGSAVDCAMNGKVTTAWK